MKLDYNNIQLFNGLAESILLQIDKSLQKSTYQKGSIIHFEHEKCEYLEIVFSGGIHIEQWNPQGDVKLIRDYHHNDIFGLNILFSSNPKYFMNVIATEDTVIYKLHISFVESLLKTSQIFSFNVIQMLSDNSTKIALRIKSDFKESLRSKIKQFLLKEEALQNNRKIQLKTTKTELAQYFGVERTSLSRELQKMKQDNMIIYDRNTITILF